MIKNRVKIILTITFVVILLLFACQQEPKETEEVTTTTIGIIELITERYVEEYGDSGALQSWLYDSENELDMYAAYIYDANGNNTRVNFYSEETTDDSKLIAYYQYTYQYFPEAVSGKDNGYRATIGEAYDVEDATETLIKSFTAEYNNKGRYTSYVFKEGDKVTESRTCDYDVNNNYTEEIYYDDEVVSATKNIIMKYNAYYDNSDDVNQYTQEILEKYVYDQTGDLTFNIKVYFQFHWDAVGHLIQQTTYDESFDVSKILLYKRDFNYGSVLKRTYLENYEIQRHIDYLYTNDADGYLLMSEKKEFDWTKGGILDNKVEYNYFTKNSKDYYEEIAYKYYHPERIIRGSFGSIKNNFQYLQSNSHSNK